MRLIDADALIQIIDDWRENIVENYGINDEYAKVLGDVIDIIDSAPTIEERKKGKWITKSTFMPDHYGGYYIDQYVCTNCESEFFKPSKFCPNCGSDQRGDGNGNVL